ncbi:hydroxyphenylacetyl-CoA thioesterase PaaI [Benzoatithermus flavus]|uniref:Hydroxyphenylacetyl-CoA thioesterase PaaI n=1 Tax=Benzoatithermus flavus TaxID=3108223 RepID=A0ABU8XUK3_9PROT
MSDRMSPEALARACADAMWAEDAASQGLGMELEFVAPGEAKMAMTVRPDMVNGHGIMHGGFIFTLADSAFAFACNTYGEKVVAQHCSITFLQPGRLGDRLTAHAVERSRSGRSGIYDIRVTNASGEIIAEFRGHSRAIGGRLVEESAR